MESGFGYLESDLFDRIQVGRELDKEVTNEFGSMWISSFC